MLFPESHEPDLKTWIVKQIENTPDADVDSEVLADYVLALLRHDGDMQAVRKVCESNLPDFLGKDTIPFVDNIFEGIKYQSYLPNAPPRPPKTQPQPQQYMPQQQPLGGGGGPMSGLSYDDGQQQHYFSPPGGRASRKRGYQDLDNPNNGARNGGTGMDECNARAFKQFRRGRGGMYEENDAARNGQPSALLQAQAQMGGQQQPTAGFFGAAAKNGKESSGGGATMPDFSQILSMNQAIQDFLAAQSRGGGGQQQRRRPRCRDYDKKGVCPRGINCNYEHITGDEAPSNLYPFPQVEEYDPLMPLFPPATALPGQAFMFENHQQTSSRPRGGKNHHRQKRDPRAAFSAEGPVFDRTKSTLVVENIPEESFSEEHVREFFSQFGTILEVTMHAYKRLAVVKFDKWASANAAWSSPKVIFDNRFVKVYWHKDDAGDGSGPVNGGDAAAGSHHGPSSVSGAENPSAMSEIDLEEFARRQEEVQRSYEEKTRRREELERQQEELETRQKELLARQAEEKRKLQEKLGAKNGGKPASEEEKKDPSKPMTQTEALRAQLAALEEEARQMGLDPDALDGEDQDHQQWTPRGGYRGRGPWRGSSHAPRARGFAPRARGGYRGRGDVHAAYAAYSLDNRPRKVVLSGVDFTDSGNDENLKQYLFGIGEFTDVQSTPESTEVTFKDRKTAEKFFNSVLLNDKAIPHVGGQLDISWGGSSNGSSGSVPTTPGLFRSNNSTSKNGHNTPEEGELEEEDDNHHGNEGSSSDDKDVRITLDRPTRTDQNEMDYEVAEDEEGQWDY
ncbi:RNA-binding protein 26 [Podospora australis]|uniref:RNA-binding protein 26 n=1 Tax=Podospora australis TaxID=1536484 RepID=A0AAN7AQC5_9PEZI|nr:RNA-binding protein 26 [Podospora australis]